MAENPQNELLTQKLVHRRLSDPSVTRKTFAGKRLQVLSPGRINAGAGPDFLNSAILLDGNVIVGNSEVHIKSSDWFAHGHDSDKQYDRVILHIVTDHDTTRALSHEILILSREELDTEASNIKPVGYDISSLDEIQHYALLRLLRKSADSQKLLNQSGMSAAFQESVLQFLRRFYKKQRRPVYSAEDLKEIAEKSIKLPGYFFLRELSSNIEIDIAQRFELLLAQKTFNEGANLRREILLNCVLPLAICLADTATRIALFDWYWSSKSIVTYGKLKRRFDLPQDYLWQQQGMLEFIRCHGEKSDKIADSFLEYGFANVLSFFKIASVPLDEEIEFDDGEFIPEWQ